MIELICGSKSYEIKLTDKNGRNLASDLTQSTIDCDHAMEYIDYNKYKGSEEACKYWVDYFTNEQKIVDIKETLLEFGFDEAATIAEENKGNGDLEDEAALFVQTLNEVVKDKDLIKRINEIWNEN